MITTNCADSFSTSQRSHRLRQICTPLVFQLASDQLRLVLTSCYAYSFASTHRHTHTHIHTQSHTYTHLRLYIENTPGRLQNRESFNLAFRNLETSLSRLWNKERPPTIDSPFFHSFCYYYCFLSAVSIPIACFWHHTSSADTLSFIIHT